MTAARIEKAAGAPEADGVHRLVDMVVEEVSLVDRAANKHRFLIVKRDTPMDEVVTKDAEDTETSGDEGSTETDDASEDAGEDSPLAAAVAALESVTAIVEALGALGDDANDPKLGALAEKLRELADELLAAVGGAEAEKGATDRDDASVAATPPDEAARAAASSAALDGLRDSVAALKASAERLAARGKKPAPEVDAKPPPARKQQAADASPELAAMAKGIAALAESFGALSGAMTEQQSRLGRVEKQFGLPNSVAPAEQVAKAAPEQVGWPLDLNKPLDRSSVDKSLSFHDI